MPSGFILFRLLRRIFRKGEKKPGYVSPIAEMLAKPPPPPGSPPSPHSCQPTNKRDKGRRKSTYVSPIAEMLAKPPPSPGSPPSPHSCQPTNKKDKGRRKSTYVSPITEMLSKPPPPPGTQIDPVEHKTKNKRKDSKKVTYVSPITELLQSPLPQSPTQEIQPALQVVPYDRTIASSPYSSPTIPPTAIPAICPPSASGDPILLIPLRSAGYLNPQYPSANLETNSITSSMDDSETDIAASSHHVPPTSAQVAEFAQYRREYAAQSQSYQNMMTAAAYQSVSAAYMGNNGDGTARYAASSEAAAYVQHYPVNHPYGGYT